MADETGLQKITRWNSKISGPATLGGLLFAPFWISSTGAAITAEGVPASFMGGLAKGGEYFYHGFWNGNFTTGLSFYANSASKAIMGWTANTSAAAAATSTSAAVPVAALGANATVTGVSGLASTFTTTAAGGAAAQAAITTSTALSTATAATTTVASGAAAATGGFGSVAAIGAAKVAVAVATANPLALVI